MVKIKFCILFTLPLVDSVREGMKLHKNGKEGFFTGQTESMMLWSKYEPPRDKENTSQY